MLLFRRRPPTHAPWLILSACLWNRTCWRCCKITVFDLLRCAFMRKLSGCVRNITAFCQHLLRLMKSATLADTDISVKRNYRPGRYISQSLIETDWIGLTETSCFDFRVATFWQSLSKEIVQYHQIISLIELYCWFSAVIFNLEVVNHFRRGHRQIFYVQTCITFALFKF